MPAFHSLWVSLAAYFRVCELDNLRVLRYARPCADDRRRSHCKFSRTLHVVERIRQHVSTIVLQARPTQSSLKALRRSLLHTRMCRHACPNRSRFTACRLLNGFVHTFLVAAAENPFPLLTSRSVPTLQALLLQKFWAALQKELSMTLASHGQRCPCDVQLVKSRFHALHGTSRTD